MVDQPYGAPALKPLGHPQPDVTAAGDDDALDRGSHAAQLDHDAPDVRLGCQHEDLVTFLDDGIARRRNRVIAPVDGSDARFDAVARLVSASLPLRSSAREVARLTAAGDMRARMVGAAVAPSGARISVVVSGDDVRVRVEAGAPLLPMLTVSGTAVALMEPRDDEGSNASITSER
mgnify:CR=1 FL=1